QSCETDISQLNNEYTGLSQLNVIPFSIDENDIKFYSHITKLGSISSDVIPPKLLKGQMNYLASPLKIIFEKSYDEGKYPDKWKVADTTPIYKNKGKMNCPNNYRPISNTMFISKVYERVIKDNMLRFVHSN